MKNKLNANQSFSLKTALDILVYSTDGCKSQEVFVKDNGRRLFLAYENVL